MEGPITRRQFVVSAGGAGAALLFAGCQFRTSPDPQSLKAARVGWLTAYSAAGGATLAGFETFRQQLREYGWEEGRNLVIELRYADGQAEHLPTLAVDLVQLPLDVLVAETTVAVRAAKSATVSLPIVMVATADPVAAGFVASLARPGGNVTGVSTLSRQLILKRLELLKEAVPSIVRVAVLWNPAIPERVGEFPSVEAAARTLDVQVVSLPVGSVRELDGALNGMLRERVDALLLIDNFLLNEQTARLAEFAIQNRLPSMSEQRAAVLAGGLMAYRSSDVEQYRRAAYFADRILRGGNPADLPVEQPMVFDFLVNMKTAREFGITFPPEILVQITEVVE